MTMENFGENQSPEPEKDWEDKETATAGEAAERVDEMVLKNIEHDIKKKLGSESAPNLLSGLKGKMIDPLYENAWLKGEPDIGQYEYKDELKESLQDAIRSHYRIFLIPGHVNYDRQNQKNRVLPPRGLGYETQIMLLEESGLVQNSQVEFFEIGKEGQIPEEKLKSGLKIHVDEEERKKYSVEAKNEGRETREIKAGPTAILYEILTKAGFFDELNNAKKLEMMGAVLFTDIIETNKWLEPTIEGFFDESGVSLFKINRLLNHDQVLGAMSDFLKDAKINWSDFNGTRDQVRTVLEKKAREPLTDDFIRKHGLENAVKKQIESIRGSKAFLKSGKNIFLAEPNGGDPYEIVYVKNPSGRWKGGLPERLPGQLPAIAAEAPKDETTGKPLWTPKSAYIEASDISFLAYIKKERSSDLVKRVKNYSEKSGISCQTIQIGGWMKIFMPFNGKLPSDFEGRLENNWLQLKANRGKKENRPRAAKTQPGKYKEAANF